MAGGGSWGPRLGPARCGRQGARAFSSSAGVAPCARGSLGSLLLWGGEAALLPLGGWAQGQFQASSF